MSNSPDTTRRILLATVGLAFAAGGGWCATKRQKGAAPVGDPLPADFWAQKFDTPAGHTLLLSSLQGKPLLVNFWATWCPPCVKEMPEIDRFHREFQKRGGQVVGLAVDSPTPVKAFLAKKAVDFQIGLAGMGGTELAQNLGNTAGALPFSVMIDASGRIRQRKAGPTSFDELTGWAKEIAA